MEAQDFRRAGSCGFFPVLPGSSDINSLVDKPLQVGDTHKVGPRMISTGERICGISIWRKNL